MHIQPLHPAACPGSCLRHAVALSCSSAIPGSCTVLLLRRLGDFSSAHQVVQAAMDRCSASSAHYSVRPHSQVVVAHAKCTFVLDHTGRHRSVLSTDTVALLCHFLCAGHAQKAERGGGDGVQVREQDPRMGAVRVLTKEVATRACAAAPPGPWCTFSVYHTVSLSQGPPSVSRRRCGCCERRQGQAAGGGGATGRHERPGGRTTHSPTNYSLETHILTLVSVRSWAWQTA